MARVALVTCRDFPELDEDDQWLAELDQTVFRTYYQIALQIKPAWATELLRRYEFQIGLQRIWERLRRQQECVNLALAFLQTAGLKLHPDEFDDVVQTFREARRELKDALKLSESMIFPALANLPAGQPLRPFLFRKKLVSNVSRYDAALESKWIEKFVPWR